MISATPQRYRISPYLFSLSVFGLICMIVCCCLFVYFVFWPLREQNLYDTVCEYLPCILFMFSILGLYFAGCILESYCLWGTYQLSKSEIILRAPLRKSIRLAYADIKYIGIDYCIVNGQYQFWIYASSVHIPIKCCGKINKLPISADTIRVQYMDHTFSTLLTILPPELKKELEKGKTVLRTYWNKT